MSVWEGGDEGKLASLQESGPTKETEEEQTEILRVRVVWGMWVSVWEGGGGGEGKLASLQESGPTKETEEEQTEILRVRVVWGMWVSVWEGG